MRRYPLKSLAELERYCGVTPDQRTHTQADALRLTRKRLGPSWGKRRRKRVQ